MSNFTMIKNDIIEQIKDPYMLNIYILLKKFSNAENICFPSISTLIELSGISRSTIIRTLKRLESCGLIVKSHKYNSSNNYRLTDEINDEYLENNKNRGCHTDTDLCHRETDQCHTDTSKIGVGSVTQTLGSVTQTQGGVTQTPGGVSQRHSNKIQLTRSNELDPMNEEGKTKFFKIENNFVQTREEFIESVSRFKGEYSDKVLRSFFNFYTKPDSKKPDSMIFQELQKIGKFELFEKLHDWVQSGFEKRRKSKEEQDDEDFHLMMEDMRRNCPERFEEEFGFYASL